MRTGRVRLHNCESVVVAEWYAEWVIFQYGMDVWSEVIEERRGARKVVR